MRHQRPFTVSFSENDNERPRELVASRDFRFDLRAFEEFFFARLPPLLIDLLRIAISVYVVDRLARRRQDTGGFRSLRVKVALLEPGFWRSHEVCGLLRECVEFLSSDSWTFTFAKDKGRPPQEEQRLLPLKDPVEGQSPLVCLYSGGLDSAAGLSRRIADAVAVPVIPVTVWHQAGQRRVIRRQYGILARRYGVQIEPLVVKAALASSGTDRKKEETSQRCRSFLFAAAGAVTATLSGVGRVEVFESGVGAINVPLLAQMVGWRATRSCHPKFFRLMSRLASLAAGREVTFCLPFMEMTKGDLVRHLLDARVPQLAQSSASCVHYPLRERPHKQCGVCAACIFRRQAMEVAGIREQDGTYKYDLFGSADAVRRVPDKCLEYLKAFLMLVDELCQLESEACLPPRIGRHLRGTEILEDGEPPDRIIRLLRQYRHEWLDIVARGVSRGLGWASWLTPAETLAHQGERHASV